MITGNRKNKHNTTYLQRILCTNWLMLQFWFRLKKRFHDRLINVRSLYSEALILCLKDTCVLQICVVFSLTPLTNLPHLVNNKKNRQCNVRVSRWELADWKNFVEIYNENKIKWTKIPYSFFPIFQMCQNHYISNRILWLLMTETQHGWHQILKIKLTIITTFIGNI